MKIYKFFSYVALACTTMLITSCVSIEQFTNTQTISYDSFNKNGIFVTEANSVSFDYTPIGSVVSVTSAAMSSWIGRSPIDIDKAFSEIGKKLKDMNADGLINFKINISYVGSQYFMNVYGMAIRRSDNHPTHTTFIEKIGSIDGIDVEVVQAYPNGMRLRTEEKLNSEQIREFYQKYVSTQKIIQFYTVDSWPQKIAYAAIVDGMIFDYDNNTSAKL